MKVRSFFGCMVMGLLVLAICSGPCLGQFVKVADFPNEHVWGTTVWNGRIYVGEYVYSADLPIYRSGVDNDSFSFVRNLGRGESIPRLWVSPDGTTLNALTEADSGQPATHWWTTDPNAQNWSSQHFGTQYRWGTAALVHENDQYIGVNNRYEPARIMKKSGSGSWQQFGPLATPSWNMLVMDIQVFNGQVYLSGSILPDYHSSTCGRVVRYDSGTNSWQQIWPFSAGLIAGSYVWDGKLWIGQGVKLYSSTNGTTWNLEYTFPMSGSWCGVDTFIEFNGKLWIACANGDNEVRIVTKSPGGPYTQVYQSSSYKCAGEFVVRGNDLYLGVGKTGGGGAMLKYTGPVDLTPPSVPTNLQATSWGSTVVDLSWTASTDDTGVTGYKVYRNGSQIGTSATPSYLDTGRTASTSYTYTVSAYDAAGNNSAQSSPVVGTTLAYDSQPPSVPTNVTANSLSTTSIFVSWTASTDNRGVLGYSVFRNGSLVGTTGAVCYFTDSGLSANTTYSYTVSALDGDGNQSAQSAVALGTTEALPNYCSIDLGLVDEGSMLTHPQNSDGDTTSAVVGGLECRRPVNTGDQYFYFAIDDTFMFDEAGTTRYLEVCYFDDQTSSVFMQPQYDSTGGAYTAAASVNFTNTGKWKTATWTLTNCKFANRQNVGADFRIYVGAYSVKIDSVRVSKVPWSNYNSVDRTLGSKEIYKGLSHPQPSDGTTTPATIAGRDCRKTTGTGSYLYFNVSDAIIYNGNPSTVYLKVDYYDSASGSITPQYDSTSGAYTSSTPVALTGTNTWKSATWTLTDARFANNQNESSDFRLGVGSDHSVHISRVIVSKVPFSDDTTPPSVPTGVSATTQSATSIQVTWTASTDNVGVSGYNIYRNGSLAGTSGTTSFTDSGLTPGTTYSYTVSAYDAAGNNSAQSSPPAVATTETIVDNDPPSVPTDVTATAQSSSSIQLTWTASTDNVGVTGYKIFRNGSEVGTSGTPGYTDTGLEAETTYSYTVSAYDAAGNNSAQSSPPATATTHAAGVTYSADDFENAVLGPLYKQTSGIGWANNNQNSWNAVAPTDTRNVSNVVEGKHVQWAGLDSIELSRNFNEAVWSGPTIYVELDYTVQSTLTDDNNVYISKGAGNSVHFEFRANGDIRERGGGTVLGKWDGTDARPELNLKTGWKRIKVTIDVPGQKYNLNIGGVDVGTNLPFRTASSDLDHIRFYRAKTGAADFSKGFIGIDNVYISTTPPGDTTPPSVPTDVTATAQSSSSIKVTWTASTDNVTVTGYKVFRNGSEVGTSVSTSYTDTGLAAGTSYSYTVSAYDAASNNSAQSSPAASAITGVEVGIASAKELGDDVTVWLTGKVVTAVFSDCIYIEEMDRYTGIRVAAASLPSGLAVGNTVNVCGVLQTVDGERRVGNALVTLTP